MAKCFINKPEESVTDSLAGLMMTDPAITCLSSHPTCIVRSNQSTNTILLSGGGSGHEPSHCGFVGEGMLHGAICGGQFASPSIDQILSTIIATATNAPFCLLIVKNYTGDRLNFTLAAKKANQLGIACSMIVVADDCAVPRDQGITGRRGVAGTVFLHKCAGAVSESGGRPVAVLEAATLINERIMSMGVSLSTVTLPGNTANERLAKDQVEVGMGIHGEAGASLQSIAPCAALISTVCQSIIDYGYGPDGASTLASGDKVALLVNNLGGTSVFEMYIIARDTMAFYASKNITVERCYVGSFMTSFNMHGASISVLLLNDPRITTWLDAPTSCKAWQMADSLPTAPAPPLQYTPPVPDNKAPFAETVAIPDFAALASKSISNIADMLSAAETTLTEHDKVCGDGDCGITMKRSATALLAALPSFNTAAPSELLLQIADTVSVHQGGTSGALFEIFCRAAALHVRDAQSNGPTPVTAEMLTAAMCDGVREMMAAGGAQAGYRTMVDALLPAVAAAKSGSSLADIVAAAKAGADATKEMKPLAGRSNYVPFEQLQGIPDPGAVAIGIILEAIYKATA